MKPAASGSTMSPKSSSTQPIGEVDSPQQSMGSAAPGKKRKTSSTPAKERRKTTRACDSCKGKKTRCSGTKPCSRCIRLTLSCEYNASYSRGKPPTPPASATVTNTHGLAIYDSPIVKETSPRDAADASAPCSPSNQHYLAPNLSTVQAHNVSSRNSPEPGAIDFEGNYIGPSSGISFLSRAWRRLHEDSKLSIPAGSPNDLSRNGSVYSFGDRPFSTSANPDIILPLRQVSADLITMYFDLAVVTYRLLHRGTIEAWLSDLYNFGDPLKTRIKRSTAGQAAVIFSVFAVARLHQGDETEPGEANSEHWFSAADHMLSIQSGPPTIETAQAKFIQSLYLLASSRANQAWYTFGTTVQLMLALGLHRKKSQIVSRAESGYIHNELRKRLYWSAYTLDKYMSVMLGRPRHLHDESTDQEYPDEVNDEDMTPAGPAQDRDFSDCAITGFIFHVKLSRIVGNISKAIYSTRPPSEKQRLDAGKRYTRDLEIWKASLPPIFSTIRPSSLVPPFSRQSNVLRLAYAHAIIHANRSFLLSSFAELNRKPHVNKDDDFDSHLQKCVNAAQTVVELNDKLACSDDWRLFRSFWFTHYCSFCAVVVLYVYTIQRHRARKLKYDGVDFTTDSEADALLIAAERCQRQLAEATREACPSRRYSIILEELRLDVHRQVDKPLKEAFVGDRIPGSRYDTNDVSQHDANPTTGTYAAQATTYALDSIPCGSGDASIYNNALSSTVPNTMAAIPDESDFPYDTWGSMDWSQLDSWAFSNPADDPLVPGDWLLS